MQTLTYSVSVRDASEYALNGTQVRLRLPSGLTFAGTLSDTVTLQGDEVVVTLGHLAAGAEETVNIPALVASAAHGQLQTVASVFSSTAQPLDTNTVSTHVQ